MSFSLFSVAVLCNNMMEKGWNWTKLRIGGINTIQTIQKVSISYTLLEGYNIVRNSSSEQIKLKWTDDNEKNYTLRSSTNSDLKVPEKPKSKCTGFTYLGSKLFNLLPKNIRESPNPSTFKTLTKNWIWMKIPSH